MSFCGGACYRALLKGLTERRLAKVKQAPGKRSEMHSTEKDRIRSRQVADGDRDKERRTGDRELDVCGRRRKWQHADIRGRGGRNEESRL